MTTRKSEKGSLHSLIPSLFYFVEGDKRGSEVPLGPPSSQGAGDLLSPPKPGPNTHCSSCTADLPQTKQRKLTFLPSHGKIKLSMLLMGSEKTWFLIYPSHEAYSTWSNTTNESYKTFYLPRPCSQTTHMRLENHNNIFPKCRYHSHHMQHNSLFFPYKLLVSLKLISITCVNYTSKPINSSFLIRFSLLKPEITKETKVNWGNYVKRSVYAKLPYKI